MKQTKQLWNGTNPIVVAILDIWSSILLIDLKFPMCPLFVSSDEFIQCTSSTESFTPHFRAMQGTLDAAEFKGHVMGKIKDNNTDNLGLYHFLSYFNDIHAIPQKSQRSTRLNFILIKLKKKLDAVFLKLRWIGT